MNDHPTNAVTRISDEAARELFCFGGMAATTGFFGGSAVLSAIQKDFKGAAACLAIGTLTGWTMIDFGKLLVRRLQGNGATPNGPAP